MFAAPPQTPPAAPPASSMSQSEVEQLLASVGGSDGLEAGAGGEAASGPGLVSRPEFPQLTSFSASEMQKLRMRCESFVHALGAHLSLHLRLECGLQMTKLETVRFQAFVDAFSHPTYLTLFRIEPLESVCLLDVPVRLALTIVDRELGGPGVCEEEVRNLTAMESKLADKVVNIILTEWCNTWADTFPMRPLVLRHESSGRFLDLSSPEFMLLSVGLEVRIAQTVESILIGFPTTSLDPLIAKLNSDLQDDQKPRAAQAKAGLRWKAGLNDVPIQVSARWRGIQVSARQLAALKTGDLLPLRQGAANQVELSLESIPKFTGQLGTAGSQMAVRIVEIL